MATVAHEQPPVRWNVPEPRGGDLTVRDLLAAPCLRDSAVLAGDAGLDRVVRRLNVMEVPDILPWVKPNELILTTAYALTRADPSAHARLLLELVTELNGRGLAAIGIKLGRYLDVMPGEVLERANELGFPIIQLPQGVAFDEILSEIFGELLDRQARVLAQADELHRTLSAIVLAGGGLPQIATEVSRLLDTYIIITASDGHILAEHGDASQRAGFERSDLIDASGRLHISRLRNGIQRPAADGAEARGIVAMTPILAAGADHGRIVAYRGHDAPPPGFMQTLERAAIVAALSITKELAVFAVEGKFRGDYLRDILSGLTPADDAVVEHCRTLGWDIDRSLVVAVAELDPEQNGSEWSGASRADNDRLAMAWQHVVRGRDKTIPVVGFSQEVVALLPVGHGDPIALLNEIVKGTAVVRDATRTFCTGVSRVVRHPAELPEAYAQARRAVRVGRRMHGRGSVSHFDALGVHRLLSLVSESSELKSFAIEVLGELSSDSPSAADLRNTLQTLLEKNLNVAETARLLHFHYNTLRYRIAKLERIIGPFTTDANLRLDVALALKVMEMQGL